MNYCAAEHADEGVHETRRSPPGIANVGLPQRRPAGPGLGPAPEATGSAGDGLR